MTHPTVPADKYLLVGSPADITYAPAMIHVIVFPNRMKVARYRAIVIGWNDQHEHVYLSPTASPAYLRDWSVKRINP